MNKMTKYLLILSFVLAGMSACIDDKSKDAHIQLSHITIQSERDTFYCDYGSEQEIQANVSQDMDGQELHYEWRARYILAEGEEKQDVDSLKYISTEPVLKYTFPKLGEFQVRLRVSNEDVSEMHYYRVFVQTGFNEGLLVLSADEQKKGRTSFLRTQNEDELVTGSEYEFKLNAFETVNPEFPFNDPTDVVKEGQRLAISCREDQVIYIFNNRTFDLLSRVDLKVDLPWMRPIKMGNIMATNTVPVLSERGDFGQLNLEYGIAYDDGFYPETSVYDRYCSTKNGVHCFVDNENSRIDYFRYRAFNSGDVFKEYRINNVFITNSGDLWTIATNEKSGRVKISKYAQSTSIFTSIFARDPASTLETATMATLTEEAQMIENSVFHVCFYTNGSALYQWKMIEETTIVPLPTDPLYTADGEITCFASSTNEKYLYLGVWNPSAETELKGSVLVYDVENHKVVKEYPGIADKPIKILYKPAN